MADLKLTSAVVSDLIALQKTTILDRKSETFAKAEEKNADVVALVDVDSSVAKLAQHAESINNSPDDGEVVISDQAVNLIALDVRQRLEETPDSFAGESEMTILNLFR